MRGLDASEIDLIGACLRAAADGPFFDDSEFVTLFGVNRLYLRQIAAGWPSVNPLDEGVAVAVWNSMNNLLGFPHGLSADLRSYVPGGSAAIVRVLARWRAAD